MTDFGFRLRTAMQMKGLNASELSRLSGVGKNLISYYLNGKYLAKQDKVFLLARALDVDPGWLMTGVDKEAEKIKNGLNELSYSSDLPKNDDVRLLIRGLNKLSPQQLEQATNMMKVMFVEYAPYFEKENNDNDA